MDVEKYYRINGSLLSFVGLWPYQGLKTRRVRMAIAFCIMVLSLFSQLAKLFETEYDIHFALESISFIIPTIGYIVEHIAFYANSDKLIILSEKIEDDWNTLREKREIDIMQKYVDASRMIALACTIFIYTGLLTLCIMLLTPSFLDVVAPLNESRPKQFPVRAEYFVDPQKYFYPIITHMILVVVIGLTVVSSSSSLFLMFVFHTCGMFKIAGLRMQKALDDTVLGKSVSEKNRDTCAKIIAAVIAHRKAIEFAEIMRSSFGTSYFVLLSVGVISLSVNMFRLFQAVKLMNDTDNLIRLAIFVFGHFYYLFLCNYAGQMLTDHSGHIFKETCNGCWYETSLRAQKLLLFVLQKTVEDYKFVSAGMFVPSLEGFAQVTSTSFSYFTVIYSTQ